MGAGEDVFLTINVLALIASTMACLPLLFERRLLTLPGRVLFFCTVPMWPTSLGLSIGYFFDYDSSRMEAYSHALCVAQAYLLNIGLQVIVYMICLYIHLVYFLVVREQSQEHLAVRERIGAALLVILVIIYVIVCELTGGMAPEGPWCSTSNGIVLMVFPYFVYCSISFLTVLQAYLIIRYIWKNTRTTANSSERDGTLTSVTGGNSTANGAKNAKNATNNRQFLQRFSNRRLSATNVLYISICALCFTLFAALCIGGIRRGITVFRNLDANEGYLIYIAYPLAMIAVCIIILTSGPYRAFLRRVFGPCCARLGGRNLSAVSPGSSASLVPITKRERDPEAQRSPRLDTRRHSTDELLASAPAVRSVSEESTPQVSLSPAAAYLLRESGWNLLTKVNY